MLLDSSRAGIYHSAPGSSLKRTSMFAVLLVCAFVFVTGTAAAQGSGTVTISDFEDLRTASDSPSLDYVLNNDIDASGGELEPIGDEEEPFTGTFDGNGYTVSGLTVNRTDEENVGFFGYVGSGGTVTNLNVEDVDITGGDSVGGIVGHNEGTVRGSESAGSVEGDSSVGGIVGYNEGTVRRSHAAGNVEGTGSVGGLVGRNLGVITESHASVEVNGEDNVGGVAGRNAGVGEVSESYATGSATGGTVVGGVVGSNGGDITDSYAMVDVEGDSTLGGLVASNVGGVVRRTYSTGLVRGAPGSGGFVGSNEGDVFESYWDSETSNQGSSSAGVPLSTEEMTGANAPRNMDLEFGETWVRRDGGYPALAWEVDGRGTRTDGQVETGDRPPEDTDEGTEGPDESPDEGMPGFGALVAVAAVLVGIAVLRHR